MQSERDSIVIILAVGPCGEDRASLASILRHSNWELCCAPTCEEARGILRENRIGVVISECSLPDGRCWKDLLNDLAMVADPPPLIVTSRLADDGLWAEVLNLGGYDLLLKPFDAAEVFHVVSLAWRHWKDSRDLRLGIVGARSEVFRAGG